ncbi:hypothetical protein M422DRAFT_275735 [Sphaerobolus stellatus SS14]|uniref:Uncharacterized protein n=1 Tax=Sphaerobolus stellatus (strain SS14) TaxID=990650 RepID=A0A0C9U3F3_SPHS4|nr:hypothetical protein M422DRAFT_275735 [Sphaerobolus stellatus SS14]
MGAFEIILSKSWLRTVKVVHHFEDDTIDISMANKTATISNQETTQKVVQTEETRERKDETTVVGIGEKTGGMENRRSKEVWRDKKVRRAMRVEVVREHVSTELVLLKKLIKKNTPEVSGNVPGNKPATEEEKETDLKEKLSKWWRKTESLNRICQALDILQLMDEMVCLLTTEDEAPICHVEEAEPTEKEA